VVDYMADRIAVMYAGRIVELAPKRQLFDRPRHPYTEVLLAAVLPPDPTLRSSRARRSRNGQNETPHPEGCAFSCRCRYALECRRSEAPELIEVEPGHLVRCHQANDLSLTPLNRFAHPMSGDHP